MKLFRITEGMNAEQESAQNTVKAVMAYLTERSTEIGTMEDAADRNRIVLEGTWSTGGEHEGAYAYGRTKQVTAIFKDGMGRPTQGQPISAKMLALTTLTSNEPPCSLLDDEEFDAISVNISTPVRGSMASTSAAYKTVGGFIVKEMQGTAYPHFIVGRKNRLTFSNTPFEELPWVQHFKEYSDLYRNELLAVVMNARGARLGEGKDLLTPEKIVSEVADGVIMLLTKSEGATLGIYPGCWQARVKYPFAKGLIVVWPDDSIKSFFNTDVIKLKRKLADGSVLMEPIGDTINSDQILYIANSDEAFDIRLSHQIGYLLKNTMKSKTGAWGIMPDLIANALVNTSHDKTGAPQIAGYHVDAVSIEELMPDYIRYLKSAGLPQQYMASTQQIVEAAMARNDEFKAKESGRDMLDTILLAARPKIGKMYMFVCLSAERTGMKPGWYHPAQAREQHELYGLSNAVGRVPFMSVGGGVQKVKWAGKSPLPNVIMAIVNEDRKDKLSQKIWEEIQAMGADSDGDRLIILSNQGLRMMEGAGLQINRNPETFKAKNPYPGLTEWTQRQLFEFWCASTPRLAQVGKGDVITRDALDAYKSGMMDWETFQLFARYGAGEVQMGVSAPKYYFVNPNAALLPFSKKELVDSMKDEGIGQGRKFQGLLYDKARNRAEEMLQEYLNETPELVTIAKGKHRRDWKGGFGSFHEELRSFEPELGVDWPTYVRRAFFRVMAAQLGITAKELTKGLKRDQYEEVQKLVREYIYKYPHRLNIWAWMIDERYIGVPKDDALKVLGLPYEEQE